MAPKRELIVAILIVTSLWIYPSAAHALKCLSEWNNLLDGYRKHYRTELPVYRLAQVLIEDRTASEEAVVPAGPLGDLPKDSPALRSIVESNRSYMKYFRRFRIEKFLDDHPWGAEGATFEASHLRSVYGEALPKGASEPLPVGSRWIMLVAVIDMRTRVQSPGMARSGPPMIGYEPVSCATVLAIEGDKVRGFIREKRGPIVPPSLGGSSSDRPIITDQALREEVMSLAELREAIKQIQIAAG